ncbi:sensor histidine kinase [Nocardioides zhouii]|uniref:histidine kinase n=1 Tax=Nocardioides zhouii TaxID=1168729 RepID=A0A4Q2T169_9ACTN|nr:sensor histidine kinase [Nocardioides zhouii]RYC10448.1 sensor histidine kinase [Nocardioides zhouii]
MTQDAAQSRKGTGLSVAGWPLGRKMAMALAIPLLLAAVLGGLRVSGDLTDSRQAGTSAKQVTIIQPAIDYLTASEAAMVAAQSDSAASQGDLIDAIDDIVTNGEALTQAKDAADLDDLQTAHVDALLDLSQALRGTEAETLGPATWIALVRQLESSVSQLITSVNAAQETPEPRLEQLSQLMSGRLSLALQQGLIATTLAQSSSQELFSEIGVEAAAIDRLAGSVAGAEKQTAQLRTQNTRHAGQVRDDSATNLDGRDAYTPYDEITQTLTQGVTSSLDEAASDARRNALIGAVLTLVALGLAIFIAFVIANSLLGPINRVREGALAVARHRLPDAVARIRAGQEPEPVTTIDVTTNEEIGQVARAVDDLHRQAIHLASGEAQLRQTVNAMFVTLSRRSNSLVNQQLAQIERLEHDEEDPKRLESLFRLDHLASRMRRTADSLLILADAPNRNAGQFSLTVGEALQAATSAVQDYQRVQILSHLNTRVGDEAAADVVHLLTELVDNALTYSPPGEPVRLAAKQGDEGVTITVTDSGLGVPPAELEILNRDLAHGAEATPDTARRMGLFVVSRLADRHDIVASLTRNPGGGMTASVLLPPSVLPELPQVAAPGDASAARAGESTSSTSSTTVETVEGGAPGESRREARRLTRAEKSQAKAAQKAAQKSADRAAGQAAAEARAEERAVAATQAAEEKAAREDAEAVAVAEAEVDDTVVPESVEAGASERPSLDSLLPRREPGANMPRTGADAFLPPETSGATGPLFGKRAETDGSSDAESGTTDESDGAPSRIQRVASVVPITALASRQRAQAEQARVAEESVEQPVAEEPVEETVAEESVVEPVAEEQEAEEHVEPVRAHDPLSDPLPEDAFDEADRQVDDTVVVDTTPDELVDDTVVVDTTPDEPVAEDEDEAVAEPAATADEDDVHVDADDPLGLGGPASSRSEDADQAEQVEHAEEPVEETVAEEAPVDEEPAEEPAEEPDEEPVAEPAAAFEDHSLNGHSTNGLSQRGAEPARAGGESPIFKSMRSGWLTGDADEIHESEIDRGWEIAAQHVAETAPVAEPAAAAVITGLPRRAPGERLVPGSVTPPTAAKTRDPDAIRRRLQSHTAGVSRGRQAAQSSPQHTEAGPA